MDDLISRQAAIDAVCTLGTELEPRGITVLAVANHKQATVDLLEQLPSAQPDLSSYSDKLWRSAYERGKEFAKTERRWIPVTERLPEPRTLVIVSYSKGVTIAQMDGYVVTPVHTEHYWRGMNGPKHTLRSVTAWMPLPEPYREDGDNDAVN